MKDESPRIFRSLETVAGREEFDTIVGAAVASYGALRNPSEHQARDFGRLVLPLWNRISAETKRSLAAALSSSTRVPRPIVEKIIAEPLETAAPFLVSSPVLTKLDQMRLAESRDLRLRKLLDSRARIFARTPPVPDQVPARADGVALRASVDAAPSRSAQNLSFGDAPSARDAEDASPATAAPHSATEDMPRTKLTSGEVRERLRKLAKPGRPTARRQTPATHAELVAFAVQQDHEQFGAALALMLGLGNEALDRIEDDASGERLAVALSALGIGAADALTILMMLKPAIGLDVTAFDLMGRYYRSLRTEDCAVLVGRIARGAGAPPLQPQYQDLETLSRQAPRKDFGRRLSLPDSSQAISRLR